MDPIDPPPVVAHDAPPPPAPLTLFEVMLWTILIVVLLPISALALLGAFWGVMAIVSMSVEMVTSPPSTERLQFMALVLFSNMACWFGLVTMWRLCLRLMSGSTKPLSAIRPAVVWSGLAIGSVIPIWVLAVMPADLRALQALLAWPLLAAVPLGIAYALRRRAARATPAAGA